ncbi:hypothetical protein THRCLA_20158 [Thraustotheca clavata]|uniref:Uncharacterized protein n=1 Tax=Thraustotheca clavata TaxID=74557 RepID=A0A1W0ABQ3_9STRA|nr:hypothetical protein THRCLA_20158 [Thraustotheca clavata]
MRRPSLAATVSAVVILGVIGTIYTVHDIQVREKRVCMDREMREGVLRDIRRDRLRKKQEEEKQNS